MEKDTKKNSFISRVMNNIKNMIKNRKRKSLPEGKIEANKEIDNTTKSADYRASMALVGAAVATVSVIGGVAKGKQDLESIDMSVYNVNKNAYEEYIEKKYGSDKTEIETAAELQELTESIDTYNKLRDIKELTDAQKETLKTVKYEIKSEMQSNMIANLYKDIFKEKMKTAYNAEKVTINYQDGANPTKEFSVEIETKTKKFFMDSKDETREIESAVWDIVELQKMQKKDSYKDKDIESFIRLYENMKGFSNLEFTKEENKPLKMSETTKVTLPDGTYTVYHMDLSDKENPKVENKTEIEVNNGMTNEGQER